MESPKMNFTREETQKLRELVALNKYVLFNKKSTAVSNRLKDETWNAIAEEFNACTSSYRSVKQLKHKFDNMKKLARKELSKGYSCDNGMTSNNMNQQPLTSDAEWFRGLMTNPGDGGGNGNMNTNTMQNDFQADTTHIMNTMAYLPPPKRKREFSPPTQMRKKLLAMSEMKTRLLHNREALVKRENMLSMSHLEEIHKQEMAQKAEKHQAQLEHETRLNEAQLNKLAIEAKLSEAQLNKVALESRQLEAQQAREAELHAVRMAREMELHEARLAREAELHAALLARETGQHINRL